MHYKVVQHIFENSTMKKAVPIRTQIRLPPELHAELVDEAKNNNASLNDVMVFHLTNRNRTEHNHQKSIPLNAYMEQEMMKIIEENLANAEQGFQKIIAEKTKLLEGLTLDDIQYILESKLK